MFCSKCGKEINEQQNCCHHCGHRLTPTNAPSPANIPVFVPQEQKSGCGKKLLIAICVFIGFNMLIGLIGAIASVADSDNKGNTSATQTQQAPAAQATEQPATTARDTAAEKPQATPAKPTPPPPPSKFDGDCGITATAHLKSNDFINHPELKISVKNTSGKNIAAIQFLAVPFDVYGNDISSNLLAQDKFYTDDMIRAGKSETLTFGPLLDQKIKSVKVYVYSVFFEDGTEWGDREASRSEIREKGQPIKATFQK